MFLGEGGGYPYTFMPAAENQRYRPKYSLRSDHAPAIQLAAAQVPPNQLRNAIGIGWSPVQDVAAEGDQGPTNAADRLCLDIFRKANIPVTDRGARLASMSVCSGLLFLQQAMNRSTGVNSAAFAKASRAARAPRSSRRTPTPAGSRSPSTTASAATGSSRTTSTPRASATPVATGRWPRLSHGGVRDRDHAGPGRSRLRRLLGRDGARSCDELVEEGRIPDTETVLDYIELNRRLWAACRQQAETARSQGPAVVRRPTAADATRSTRCSVPWARACRR